jgi:dimethylargininase
MHSNEPEIVAIDRAYGSQSMVESLRRVAVRPPDETFANADPSSWHYSSAPDLDEARAEHAVLVEILRNHGAEVIEHERPADGLADAIFVHDPLLVTDHGTVVLRMGKELRRGEEEPLAATLEDAGVPILGRLTGNATAEGGDLVWLDHDTLAVGQGFRTNADGLAQLESILRPIGVTCVAVPLPFYDGAAACLHLMSIISMLADDLAVVYEPLLPVPFWRLLRHRGIEIVPVPHEEFATQAPNVLALAPRRCVMLEDNAKTQARLEAAGCEVLTYRGRELSLKAEGGATCLTRPVLRSAP